MTEILLNANTLPEPLLKLVHSEKVRVRESNGVITLLPADENFDCTAEIFGMYSDSKMSVDKFLEQKHADKALEL
ncbi:MAG: hypothetical protein LBF92_10905 [Synergistaceae bacterium]|jgi:hypothetical protein|nr:hypothetical protein [Synergistaceae bacterium]